MQPLSRRRVLVTAGPTWVPLDDVRHLGNFSTGRTGLTIARRFAALGAEVVLMFGPGRASPTDADRRAMRVIDFVTFDDLRELVHHEVGSRTYDVMIHTAAVSDFRPVSVRSGKTTSAERWTIELEPTPKIVDEVRPLDPGILLVKFKLESGVGPKELERIADESRRRSDADLVVANDLRDLGPGRHPALIWGREGLVDRASTTDDLADRLAGVVARLLGDHQPDVVDLDAGA